MVKGSIQKIPFFVYDTTTGEGVSGLTGITCKIAKDGNSWTDTTNSPAEQDSGTAPGWYTVELTAAETSANIIQLHFTHATATIYDVTIMPDESKETIASAVWAAEYPAIGVGLFSAGSWLRNSVTYSLAAKNTATEIKDTATAIKNKTDTLTNTDVTGLAKTSDIPTANAIATSVLTADTSAMPVTTDAYTLKHLIMASQCSETTTTNSAVTWTILDSDKTTAIADRTLTLNTKGAIVSVK